MLDLYANGKLCKPEIQRGYVWKKPQVAYLIDSLYHDYPIGLLLLWEPENTKHLRPLKDQGKQDPQVAIIDGQQRLVSLQEVLLGKIPVVFNVETEKFQLENKATKADLKWISVSALWNTKTKTTFSRELGKKLKYNTKQEDDLAEKLDRIIYIKSIKPVTFTVHGDPRVSDDEQYSRITDIFVRLNKSGRKLKKTDIALATGKLKFPGLLIKKLEKLEVDYKEFIPKRKSTSFYANALGSLANQTVEMKAFENYLYSTKPKDLTKKLKNLDQGLEGALEFLTSNFGINEKNNMKLIPSINVLLILVYYYVQTGGKLENRNKELLKLWTFSAFHHARYSGSTASTINKDLGVFDLNDRLSTIKTWIKSIRADKGALTVKKLGDKMNNTNRFTLFFALKLNDAYDWWSGSSIESMTKTEDHHIFPRKLLRGKYPDEVINDPRNIALVSRKMNRKIGARSPEDYFTDQTLISDISRVHSQFIPKNKELLKVKNYKKFLDERGKLIMGELNKFVSARESKI